MHSHLRLRFFKRGLIPLAFCAIAFMPSLSATAGVPAAFTNEALVRGIDYVPDQAQFFGDGLAFVDLDGDVDPDIVVVGAVHGAVGVYENDGSGFFIDRTATSGIGLLTDASGVTAADYDRDGDLDVFITRRLRSDALLRNDGGFVFTNVTVTSGVGDTLDGYGAGWGDYDNDGWIDLYVANRITTSVFIAPNRLYRNLGDGTFLDMAASLGVDRTTDPTFQGTFFDFDRDGDADLYLATDKGLECATTGQRNHLYENIGGTFVDITDASGTEACIDAMCVAIGDFDGNRHPDIYSTNTTSGNVLLTNPGNGVFDHAEAAAGVQSFDVGWGSVFFDYDNDGILDLYVCNVMGPNRLYHHEGTWPCVDLALALDVEANGQSFAVAAADIENDGDVDLLVMNRDQRIRLLVNHEGETKRWAKFDVVGEGPNRYAIGANVDVRTNATWQIREVIAGSNYKSQNELVLHFGLNTALIMDEIQIMWPGAATRSLFNYPSNQTWTLYPTDKLGDGDRDGDRELDDFLLLSGCFTNDLPASIQPGCEMMDFDGNGAVGAPDLTGFLAVFDGVVDDCNGNGQADMADILLDGALDGNANGVLDFCEFGPPSVPAASSWGIVVLTLSMFIGGCVVFRRGRSAVGC